VIREEENGNIVMRAVFAGTTGMTMVTEIKVINNLYPDDFKYFIENWGTVAPKLNPQLASITLLPEVEGYGTAKSVANAPYPLSNRVSFTARYPQVNYREHEHIFVVSSLGLDRIISQNLTEKEKNDLVIATVFIGGWWF
jgi:hypothetical protein